MSPARAAPGASGSGFPATEWKMPWPCDGPVHPNVADWGLPHHLGWVKPAEKISEEVVSGCSALSLRLFILIVCLSTARAKLAQALHHVLYLIWWK